MARRISHVIGFDDAPFPPGYRGDVLLVGAVYAGPRLEGVLSDKVRRDGVNATRTIVRLVSRSHYREHLQAVLLQGFTFAGFNVVDLQAAFDALRLPVIAVSRRQPVMEAVRNALLHHVPGGQRKWRLITEAGPVDPVTGSASVGTRDWRFQSSQTGAGILLKCETNFTVSPAAPGPTQIWDQNVERFKRGPACHPDSFPGANSVTASPRRLSARDRPASRAEDGCFSGHGDRGGQQGCPGIDRVRW